MSVNRLYRISELVLLLTLLSISADAQTIIEGSVLDGKGGHVDSYVTISTNAGFIIGYTDTDEKGNFQLKFASDADSVIVTAAGLSFESQKRHVPNRSQKVCFCIQEHALELKEVTIKALKISQNGDTLNYNVSSYTQQNDRVIGDVLKKMPGIEVSEGGSIKYNGKTISKFYVEDMDMLQGRYGLATNNIKAQDVATVQVMENHQPIKMLQGRMLSDDVAINLKLRKAAKGTVAVNAMFGGGIQAKGTIGDNPLWTAELIEMYFEKRRQNMMLYKGNNIGEDVSQELASHYNSINSVGLYPFCPSNTIMPSISGLSQKRTFDNRSHLITANHLESFGTDDELTFNISYYNDAIKKEGSSKSELFVDNTQRLVSSEKLMSETSIHNLQAQIQYNNNTHKGFLIDVLDIASSWNSDEVNGDITSDYIGHHTIHNGTERILQHFHRPQLSISNTFNTILNFGKTLLDLHFSGGYAQRPNTLSVDVDSSMSANDATQYIQNIISRHIAANFYTNYDIHLGSFKCSYGISGNMGLHGITTDLRGYISPSAFTPSDMLNDLWYNIYEATLGQNYTFEQSGWQVKLGCPLILYTQALNDHIRQSRDSYTRLLITPSISACYDWLDWSGGFNAHYEKTLGDPGCIYSGYIMNNYRSFQRSYVDQLSETDRWGIGFNMSYRSAIYATFVRLNADYLHTHDNQTYGYNYHGATSVIQAVDNIHTCNNYSLNIDTSKGLDWLQTTLRLFGAYNYYTSERLISERIYPYHSNTVNLGAGGTITPVSFLNFVISYGCSWSKSIVESDNNEFNQQIRTSTLRLNTNVFVTKELSLTAIIEDNYNNITLSNRHCYFSDIQMQYKLKHVDLNLECNNIFNQKTYSKVMYDNLDIFTSTNQLRPFNVIATVRFKLL
jgi:hypothetical protein